MKRFKFQVVAEIELPSKAELVSFTDQDGITTDHIKLGGKLLRPDFLWMEYMPSKKELNEKKWHPDMLFGWESGTEFCEEAAQRTSFPTWFIEEAPAK